MEKGQHPKLVNTFNGPQMASMNLSLLGRLRRFRIATSGLMAVKQGYPTGIPTSEVTVVEPPALIPVATLTTPAKSGPSDKEGDGNEISVLVTPQGRLQISADLDVKGLGKLKQMLEQYEQILKLLQ